MDFTLQCFESQMTRLKYGWLCVEINSLSKHVVSNELEVHYEWKQNERKQHGTKASIIPDMFNVLAVDMH